MKKRTMNRIAALVLALVVMIPVGVIGVFADEPTGYEANVPDTKVGTPNIPAFTATEGWGDPDGDGIYEIATPGDLLACFQSRTANKYYKGKTIVLTADIDMNPGWDASSNIRPTNEWNPSEKFHGVIDGQGHTIKGIFVNEGDKGDEMSFANFIRNTDGGFTMKNVRFENCLFYAPKSAAGLIGFVRGAVVLENVYADIICEVGTDEAGRGIAAGFVSRYRCTGNNQYPTVEMTNCVFAGKVIAPDIAAAFIGTNDRMVLGSTPTKDKGLSDYHATLTDCVNYGDIICADSQGVTTNGQAAGLIGEAANITTLVRCYNAGTVTTASTKSTALVNVAKSEAATETGDDVVVTLEDCYYLGGEGIVGMTETLDSVADVVIKYDGVAANETKTATVAELLSKDAFKASATSKGWTAVAEGAKAVPVISSCLFNGHTAIAASAVVTAPTCATNGYTANKCSICDASYNSDYKPATGHTYGQGVVKAPTCAEDGYTGYTCTQCQYEDKRDLVDKVAHTPGEWIIDKEATVDFAGMKHQDCTVCGAEEITTEIIQKLTGSQTTETTAAETTAPETDAPATEEKKGCGSSIALGSALGMVSIIGLGAVALGKKRR